MSRVLIVRLSALGDIVHALPVLAALRRADPQVQVDWLVEEAYAPVLALTAGLRQRVIVRAKPGSIANADTPRFAAGLAGYLAAIRYLRTQRYDVALDLQGLIKSAAWARASGARRVIGFAPEHVRERQAAWLYHETVTPPHPAHVIQKNLSVAAHLGADVRDITVSLDISGSASPPLPSAAYAVLNPGAAWPNKRWPAERFGAVARALAERHGLISLVSWGPAERELAESIVAASGGAARLSPPTSVADLAVLLKGAALVISGDTGPLHIAAAVGAPLVGLYGPTWPERNGPWDPGDEVISRAAQCGCHHKRRCLRGAPCIETITVDEVIAAADRRLGSGAKRA